MPLPPARGSAHRKIRWTHTAPHADVSRSIARDSQRCALCHGPDIKGTGPLAKKSNPSTPDLTTPAFKQRLNDYPGGIVSSVILRPNGNLIPKTLQENSKRSQPAAAPTPIICRSCRRLRFFAVSG
ncbi:hypothetical protein [Pseudomonas sp. RIT-PI-r]|uniref:hypothetical protein n=1 Tax=Pseudomonas sp. RIT-PI-r TaxID=1699620 RepID=UPI003FA6BCC9